MDHDTDSEPIAKPFSEEREVASIASGGRGRQLHLDPAQPAAPSILDDEVDLGTVAVAKMGQVDRSLGPSRLLV